MARGPITTHVLDTAQGKPAAAVPVVLEIQDGQGWKEIARGQTDNDGRMMELLPADYALAAGVYRIVFDTRTYYSGSNGKGFYPYVSIVFEVAAAGEHYHVPLLLSPFGYSTYRGS